MNTFQINEHNIGGRINATQARAFVQALVAQGYDCQYSAEYNAGPVAISPKAWNKALRAMERTAPSLSDLPVAERIAKLEAINAWLTDLLCGDLFPPIEQPAAIYDTMLAEVMAEVEQVLA